MNDHLEQALDESLCLVHLLAPSEELDRFIRVAHFPQRRVLILCLEFPFLLQAQAEHQSFQSVETKAVQFTAPIIYNRIFANHLPLELVNIVLTFDL